MAHHSDPLHRASGAPRDTDRQPRSGSLARRRPVTVFLLLALGLGWAALMIPALTGVPMEPFLLFVNFVALLGSALVVTRLADGPGGIRRLLGRAFAWRFGAGRWAVVLLGMHLLDTGGSVLVIGIQHASWNAAVSLGAVEGE